MNCIIKDCNNLARSNKGKCAGYCNKHRLRLRRHGNVNTVLKRGIKRKPTYSHFKKKIKVNKKTDCWEWTGSKVDGKYGHLGVNGKIMLAHRFSYEYFIDKIPKGMCVCHTCDNPPCVNLTIYGLGLIKIIIMI